MENLAINQRKCVLNFVISNTPVPDSIGHVAFDFGCGPTMGLSWHLTRLGYTVVAIDLQPPNRNRIPQGCIFLKEDLFTFDFPVFFHFVLNASTIEQVGIIDKHGVDADIKAMGILKKMMGENATQILVLPVGVETVFPKLHRVYGKDRLYQLLDGYDVVKEQYWSPFEDSNQYQEVDAWTAFSVLPTRACNALGCFVLRKDTP